MVLEHSDEFYRSVYEHSMDAVLLAGLDGSVLAANPAACRLFLRTEEELCRLGRTGLVDSDSAGIARFLEERERTGSTRGELVYVRGDGSRFPGEFRSVVFADESGEPRALVTIRDISEIRQAAQFQEELLEKVSHEAAEIETILESQEDIVLLYDPDMNVRRANSAFRKNYGFDPVGTHFAEIIDRVFCRHLDGLPLVLSDQPTPRALRGEQARMQYVVTKVDGTHAVIETSSRPLLEKEAITGTVTVWHDITELKHVEDEMRKSSEEIEDLYNNAPCGYHSLDQNGLFLRINDTELSWLGYRREEVIGKKGWKDVISPSFQASLKANFRKFMKTGYVRNLEYEMLRSDGSTFVGLVNATAVYDDSGNYQYSRGLLMDITERKLLEKRLEQQARMDALTGLNNRRYFLELARHELSRNSRFGSQLAFLMIDIDQFKAFNDTYGHDAGDAVLAEMGRICARTMREIDIVGRMGGEEFAAVLPGLDISQAVEAAERLRRTISNSQVRLESGKIIHFTVSIGVACLREADESLEALLKQADNGLYAAKHSGRNCVRSTALQGA
jgi:diguanylate cyclase (GGDEF)-like protein/PAS domain S-box-containing protein